MAEGRQEGNIGMDIVHEKLKDSRHHKISDLGTLDTDTKGKIRQRIFCDQHPENEIRLFCRDCKVLICLMCKAVNHENHTSRTVADYASEMRKTLESKKDECSDKLRRMNDSKAMAEELDRQINDEEIEAVEEQHLQLKKVLEQEVANVKKRIKNVYHDLRQQIAVFKKCVEDELVTCYNAQENVQKITNQGTDIDIIRNGPNLEQLISASMSKTDPTHTTVLKNKLFSPASIDASELIPLIDIMQDSTNAGDDQDPYYGSDEDPYYGSDEDYDGDDQGSDEDYDGDDQYDDQDPYYGDDQGDDQNPDGDDQNPDGDDQNPDNPDGTDKNPHGTAQKPYPK